MNSISIRHVLAALAVSTAVGASALHAQQGVLATAAAVPATRFKSTDTLPFESGVVRGTLPNGLVYYIRKNAKPEHRAELRLVVRAGSLQEDDDQRGLAHMVEHMQFEGSPHFPNRSLVNYLESIGMVFGADLNALTTFDNTTYQLRVPTNDPVLLAKGFDVLQDWAGGATFESVALAAQRGIVLEEWRRGQGVGARMQKQTFPVLFHGSRYAQREPIGDPAIITSATREKLVRFYHDWYRPNLMAVIAVGDFDPTQVEAMIKARFTSLTNPQNPRPRIAYTVPDNADPLVAVVTDTEVTGVGASISYVMPVTRRGTPPKGTAGAFRESLARSIFQSGLAQRYREITLGANAPFLGASASFGGLTEQQGMFSISVSTRNDALLSGLDGALVEIERVAKYGLTDAELARIRTAMLSSAANGYAERNDIPSASYVEAYRGAFLGGVPVSDIVTSIGLLHQFLPTITNDDIKRIAALWRTPGNRIVIAQLPKSLDVMIPDTSSLLGAFDYPIRHVPTPYVEVAHNDLLLPILPTPGSIVSRTALANGIAEWTLSNGIRVLLRPSTNTADRVAIVGASLGGYNLELDKGTIPAQTASDVVLRGGLGTFSQIDLGKRLAGHAVQMSASIGPTSEGIAASAITNDLETAFQLIYLVATKPRLDVGAVARMQAESREALQSRGVSPEDQFQDTIALTMAQHNPLVRLPTVAMIDSMDPIKSLEVYKNRFRDMSDFRFVVVGHFVPDSIAPLVERYIASLPGGGRKETPKDMGVRPPTGMVHKVVAAGTEPKATTLMTFYGPFEMSPENEWNLYGLSEVIKLRLTERLRQELGGTYSPSVQLNMSLLPYPNYSLTVSFITSPERDEELAKATIAVFDSLQRVPALAADIEKVREAQLHGLDEARKSDSYWLGQIQSYDDLHRPFNMIGSDVVVRAWTGADVQRAAKQYLRLDAYARFDLVPASGAPSQK